MSRRARKNPTLAGKRRHLGSKNPHVGTIPIAKKCLQIGLCGLRWPHGTQRDRPRARGPQGPQPPRPAPDARPAAQRGPGHRHHAGRPARPQQRRDVLPPAPAREARLRRRGHHSAATPGTAGGGAPHQDDAGPTSRTRRRRRSTTPTRPTCRPSRWSTPSSCSARSRRCGCSPGRGWTPATSATGRCGSPRPGPRPWSRRCTSVVETWPEDEDDPERRAVQDQRQRVPASRLGGRRRTAPMTSTRRAPLGLPHRAGGLGQRHPAVDDRASRGSC